MHPGPQGFHGGPPPAAAPSSKFPVWAIILIVFGLLVVVGVGVLAALAVFGTRRYLEAAKTAEAKNTLGAIARSARFAFEERATVEGAGKLCASAQPVPARIPAGTKYAPVASGGDFDTGDAVTGWKCLKFSMTMPMYYQYSYNQGGGYLAPSVSPGPDGFEAAARGDLDGDGTTSLFVMTGKTAGGTLTTAPSLYIENETE